jgi:septation ring formation regulator EzrA
LSAGAIGAAAIGWVTALWGAAKIRGAESARLDALDEAFTRHGETHVSIETVSSLSSQLAEQSRQLKTQEEEIKRVTSAVNEIQILAEQVKGLDRLVTTQLDEIKHSLRRMEERSFDPPAPPHAGRPRRTSDPVG